GNASHNKKGESGTAGARTFVERKKTAFLHAHAVQLLLWTWYPADYNEFLPVFKADMTDCIGQPASIYIDDDNP
ncbi:MAG: hypothetical protein IKI23_12500, partial [Lachnospiraceae bacterium]|nr:hypothetical protein [Lachnospiraceae bacterium]